MRSAFYITVDDGYLGLGLALARRLASLWGMDVHVFLENGGAPERGTGDGQRVFLHRNLLKGKRPQKLPHSDIWPPVIYDRIYAPQLLTEYDRLVYLDADIYPLAPAPEFLKVSLPGGLAAVHDVAAIGGAPQLAGTDRTAWLRAIGIGTDRYFNSGMLVIDPKLWAETDFHAAMVQFLDCFGDGVRMPDQDFLNHHFQGRWTELSPRYNFQKALFPFGYEAIFQPVFLHFSSSQKPWLAPDMADSVEGQFHPLYQEMLAEAGTDPVSMAARRGPGLMRRLRKSLRAELVARGLPSRKHSQRRRAWEARAGRLFAGFAADARAARYADLDFTLSEAPRPRLVFDGQDLRRRLDVGP